MNALERIKNIEKSANDLMERNQKQKNPEIRKKMGFQVLYNMIQEIKWLKQDLEHIY